MDNINHPKHYNFGKIETYDYIEDQGLNYSMGNVIKYVSRAGKKKAPGKSLDASALEDLKKARWYLDKEIARREAKINENISRSTT